MASINDFIAQSQAMENSKNNLQSQFNQNYQTNKSLYLARKQALETGRGLADQLLGQERTEAIIGAAPVATRLARAGFRAAQDPQGTAQAISQRVSNLGNRVQQTAERFKTNLSERAEQIAQENLSGGIADDARRTAGLPSRDEDLGDVDDDLEFGLNRASGLAQRFSNTLRPNFRAPRNLPEPEDVDFRNFQAPTREEGMRAVAAQNERIAEQQRVDTIRSIDPADVTLPEPNIPEPSLSEQITGLQGHTLRPTETRTADPLSDISPSDIGLQLPSADASNLREALPISRAREPIMAQDIFPPPPRELRNVNPAVTEGEASEGGLRGDQTIARALQIQEDPKDQQEADVPESDVFEQFKQGAIERARAAGENIPEAPRLDALESEGSNVVPSNINPAQSDEQLQARLARLKEPSPSDPVPSAATETSAAPLKDIAKTSAEKIIPEEAAESALDILPGVGELVMAGTLIGGLVKAGEDAKKEDQQTAGAPPQPQQAPQPQFQFDVAPTLDTSSFHTL